MQIIQKARDVLTFPAMMGQFFKGFNMAKLFESPMNYRLFSNMSKKDYNSMVDNINK
jgi:hypothetical protein